MMVWRFFKHILATEVSIWSRRYNAYVLGGSAEVTTSRRSAVGALLGYQRDARRERAIDAVFRVLTGQRGHCRSVLLDDYADAIELSEFVETRPGLTKPE